MKKLIYLLFVLGIALPLQAQIDRSQVPTAGPTPVIQLKKPVQYQLKNGLKVLIVENHKLPRVSMQLRIDHPPIYEGDKVGTSSLLGAMLGKGSESISKDDFNEEVDFLGASINYGALSASASSLSKVYPRILELMADAALHPHFTQEEFDKEKEKLITGIKSIDKSVNSIASRLQQGVAYGTDHALGEFESEESVRGIVIEDIQKFYETHFTPNQAYLVIIGDVQVKEAKNLAKKYFSSWKKAPAIATYKAKDTSPQKTSIAFVDMPNAQQSVVAVQNLVPLKMSDKDYLDALLANNILGGTSTARLFMNLREDKAYTYGSYSSIGNDKYDQSRFRAYASVRNAVTDSAAVQILNEIDRMQNEKVSDKELEDAKAIYMGSFVMAMEKPETIARYALNIATENLPDNFYETYLSRLQAVTPEDVLAASKKYLRSDQAQIVIAGRGKEVLENLEKMEFKGQTLPIHFYTKTVEKTARPNYDAAIPEGLTAKAVIDSYIEALGGVDRLRAIQSIGYTAEAEMQGMKLEIKILKTAKNQYKQSMSMMGNTMSEQVFNGESGFVSMRGQKMPIPEEQLGALRLEAAPFPELDMDSSALSIEGVETMGDTKAYKIALSKNKSAYFDVSTGLKLKEVTQVEAQGQTVESVMEFGDYREKEGVLLPYSFQQQIGPRSLEFKISSLQINPEVSDEDFK